MTHLSISKRLFTHAFNNNGSIAFKEQYKLFVITFLFFLLQISCIIIAKAQIVEQPAITICAGEEVVLSGITMPSQPQSPAQGPIGTPQIICSYLIETIIEPTEGLINVVGNSYTVAPSTTTSYIVSSRYVPGPQAPDYYYPNAEACLSGAYVSDLFEVIVEECSNSLCNVTDPFTELPWLNELINFEDDNGFGYYDYVKLFELNGNTYLEIFPELNGSGSEIYTCDGVLFCQKQNSLSCNQFNETNLVETLYDSNCTSTVDQSVAGDNKIDIEAVKVSYPTYVSTEGSKSFRFEFKNNGPCKLFETDFVIEINGTIIETKKVTGSIFSGRRFTVRSEQEFYFEPDTEYQLKAYPVNPNGNRDLNFANDTLYKTYKFNRNYSFNINQFISPQSIAFEGQQEVNIALTNNTNASFSEAVYVNWSVNGIEQSPVLIEDIQGDNILMLGEYIFEADKDYEITASIKIPSLSDSPLAQLTYFINKNSAKVDLAIATVKIPAVNPDVMLVKIENKGNVDVSDFIINWTYNGITQEPIDGSNYNWRWYAKEVFFDKYTTVRIENFNLDESATHTFNFSVEIPDVYIDANPENNSFTYEAPSITDEEVYDRVYQICEGDSITMQVLDFIYYPDATGLSFGCTKCTVSFNNQQWMVNEETIGESNTITIKPSNTNIFTFSTDATEFCATNCGPGPGSDYSDSYDQPDVRIKVIVEACQKQEADCLNHKGEVGQGTDENGNMNEIKTFSGESLFAYDVNGNAIDLKGDYVRFDYEIKGPVLTDGSIQPITITCLEEIYEDFERKYIEYDVCVGDQIEAQFQIPENTGTGISSVICNSLKNYSQNNVSVESIASNNCTVNFTVNDTSSYGYTSIDYFFKLQTTNRPQPLNLNWDFGFRYQENCVQECLNNAGLMQTSSSFVCAGDWVYVREVFSTIDENSVKAYLIHEEKEFDGSNYIAIHPQGRFTSQGASYNNQPLYISAIIGPPNENGIPDFDNDCTVWTSYGAKYTFFDPITINVVDERCENEGHYVDLKFNGGVGSISPNWAYRSVSDGIKTLRNVSANEVITFGPYQGESEYQITAKGAKGCKTSYSGTYNCGGTNRKASIISRSSGIFEINYADPSYEIETVQVFNMNAQIVQANIQIDSNSCEVKLQNHSNGSIYFMQLLVTDGKTGQSFLISEKLYKK